MLGYIHVDPIARFLMFASVWCLLSTLWIFIISPPVGGRLQAPSVFTVSSAACTHGGHIPGSEVAGLWSTRSSTLRNVTKFPSRVGGITHTPRSNRRGPGLRILTVSGRRKLGVCPVMPVGWCLVVLTHSAHDGCGWPSFTCHWSFAFTVALPLCVTVFNSPFLWLFNCFLGVVYVFWIRILHQLDVR